MALPLVELTKTKCAFVWNPGAQKAFENLKNALSHAPMLAIADDEKPYEVICDASGFDCGAVLMQENRLVAFWSYKMSPAETRYHTGEQEVLAVIGALKHWRHYVQGADFTIVTDHKPNVTFDTKNAEHLSNRQIRWGQFLANFEYKWEWRKGVANVADALSRNPALLMSVQDTAISGPSETLLAKVKEGYARDPFFQDAKKLRPLVFDEEFWRQENAIVVPQHGNLRAECVRLHHDTPYSGHLGRDRTLNLVLRNFWWPSVYRDVVDYVSHCDVCQRAKTPNQKVPGLLQPLSIPERAWESVSMDLITQLPETSRGHAAIAVFVSWLTKMVRIAPTICSVSSKYLCTCFSRRSLQTMVCQEILCLTEILTSLQRSSLSCASGSTLIRGSPLHSICRQMVRLRE